MPKCLKCSFNFPNRQKIDGKTRAFNRRKFCLGCSPFGKHNTSKYLNQTSDKDRTCSSCNKTYSLTRKNFYFNNKSKGTFASTCISCRTQQMQERLSSIKQKCVDYKGGKCELCGYSKCLSSLTFHHCNPKEKEFEISQQRSYSMNVLKKELDKCSLLCRNCHGETHAGLHPSLFN